MLDVMTTNVALTQKLNCVILIRSFEHILVQWFLNFSIEVLWKTFLIKKWGGKRILQELDLKTYSNDSILIYALNFNSIKIHTTSIFNFLYAIAVIVSQNARLFSNNNRCAKTTTKINWKRCAIVCVVAVAVTPLSLSLPMPHCIQWHNNSRKFKIQFLSRRATISFHDNARIHTF